MTSTNTATVYGSIPTAIHVDSCSGTPRSSVDARTPYFYSRAMTSRALGSLYELFGGNQHEYTVSLGVYNKLDKYIKAQKKMMKAQEDLIREIAIWSDDIVNHDSRTILNEFNCCLQIDREIGETHAQKLESLRIQLKHVQKREQKCNDLKAKRNKLYKSLRQQEGKGGETANTTLVKEHLEELTIAVDVVEEQYIRSINRHFRTTICEYMVSLTIGSSKLRNGVEHFFTHISGISSSSTSPPKRLAYTIVSPEDGFIQQNTPQILTQSDLGSSTGGSATPIPMNPLNQKSSEMISNGTNYLNILKTQLQKGRDSSSSRPHSHSDSKPPSSSSPRASRSKKHCKFCKQMGITCDHSDDAYKWKSTSVPGALDSRIPSTTTSVNHWKH